MRFETSYTQGSRRAEVILTPDWGKLIYTIDMVRDVIEKITFSRDGSEGELRFSYLEEIDDIGGEFAELRRRVSHRGVKRKGSGMLWLVKLISDK